MFDNVKLLRRCLLINHILDCFVPRNDSSRGYVFLTFLAMAIALFRTLILIRLTNVEIYIRIIIYKRGE